MCLDCYIRLPEYLPIYKILTLHDRCQVFAPFRQGGMKQ